MSRWDRDLPVSREDIIELLLRRIEVHRRWAAFIREDPAGAGPAVNAGVGSEESHERYAAQYQAAIEVLRCS